MGLSVVTSRQTPRRLATLQEAEDFEQEIVDQYALAMSAAGLSDGHVGNTRSVVIEFARSLAAARGRQAVMMLTGSWLSSAGRGVACPPGRARRARWRCSSSS